MDPESFFNQYKTLLDDKFRSLEIEILSKISRDMNTNDLSAQMLNLIYDQLKVIKDDIQKNHEEMTDLISKKK